MVKKILKYFLIIIGVIIIIKMSFSERYRYRQLNTKDVLTPKEQRILKKHPNSYFLVTSDDTLYYVYKSGLLVTDGGFYKLNY